MLSFFPPDVLDGIWDLIESVSEGFLTYSYLRVYVCFFLSFFHLSLVRPRNIIIISVVDITRFVAHFMHMKREWWYKLNFTR